ncbi:MAG: hypothetical protein AUK55_08160 [Syntrophobacteraceae bacterium CG2_30_61_12]|nr:MAG: hypothetical protein AUK55_08160 [Syntrophobacteraceae bacterium CG2_30_61_12]
MMKRHGHKDGEANERLGYGDRVYRYNPNPPEKISFSAGIAANMEGRGGISLTPPKNTLNELIFYDENYSRNRRELEAAGKGLKQFEKPY